MSAGSVPDSSGLMLLLWKPASRPPGPPMGMRRPLTTVMSSFSAASACMGGLNWNPAPRASGTMSSSRPALSRPSDMPAKQTTKRLGAACAQAARGDIASRNGRAMPTPPAPRRKLRRFMTELCLLDVDMGILIPPPDSQSQAG